MIYKTKDFITKTKKAPLSDAALRQACREMRNGLIDADLGGNVYKKRVASSGKGKRGSYRTIIGALIGDKYFFLYAFAKNKRANINNRERLALRELTDVYLHLTTAELELAVAKGELIEVGENDE